MPHPARTKAFGKKANDIPQDGPIEVVNKRDPAPKEQETNAFWRILDRLLLWIPHEASPGFQALCLVALRMFFIPLAIALPLIALSAAATGNAILAWITAPLWILRLTCSSLIHELCRYSFVRRADRPLRAASIFACACLLAEVVGSRSIAIGVTDALVEIIASAAILVALNRRRNVPIVIAALVAIGATVNAIIPKFVVPKHVGPVSQDEPVVGNMRSWAKLYPGSTITLNRPQKILNLTQWEVSYVTNASPDRVADFYNATAGREGFALESDLFGIKTFRNPLNGDRFSYSAKARSSRSEVFFIAKCYGT